MLFGRAYGGFAYGDFAVSDPAYPWATFAHTFSTPFFRGRYIPRSRGGIPSGEATRIPLASQGLA